MGLMDKIKGEIVDIIEWIDDSRSTLAWRFPRYQNEIKNGAELIVREGQEAVFVYRGQLADRYGPGHYTLTSENMPIMSTIQGWKHGFNSPFRSEVYFLNTRPVTDLRWGTPQPVTVRDPDFKMVQLRANGLCVVSIGDAEIFLQGGHRHRLRRRDRRGHRTAPAGHHPRLQRPHHGDRSRRHRPPGTPGRVVRQAPRLRRRPGRRRVRPRHRLDHDEHLAARRGHPGHDPWRRPRCRGGQLRPQRGRRPGPPAGAHRRRHARRRAEPRRHRRRRHGPRSRPGDGQPDVESDGCRWGGQQPQAAPAGPPPLPAQQMFHIDAGNGQQAGPYGVAQIQQGAANGQVTAETLVWTAGMAAWTPAGQVPALAAIFAAPPPMPPGPPPSAGQPRSAAAAARSAGPRPRPPSTGEPPSAAPLRPRRHRAPNERARRRRTTRPDSTAAPPPPPRRPATAASSAATVRPVPAARAGLDRAAASTPAAGVLRRPGAGPIGTRAAAPASGRLGGCGRGRAAPPRDVAAAAEAVRQRAIQHSTEQTRTYPCTAAVASSSSTSPPSA